MKTVEQVRERANKNRERIDVTLRVPAGAFELLQELAEEREISVESLMNMYISFGLRDDLAARGEEKVLASTFNVLYKHLRSKEQVDALVEEIRLATADV